MKLTVLGCSGSAPGPDSPASGYLLEQDDFRLVLDLGHGAFGALQRYIGPADVDAIVLSHLHADHCIDLTAHMVALRYGGYRSDPTRRVRVIGPAGTRDRIAAAYDPMARKLGLHELYSFATPANGELGPFQVAFAPMSHPVPTSAVRVTCGGRSLTYSGDTGESDKLVELASGTDLLLCEATLGPDDVPDPGLHLSGRQAGEHAERAGVAKLVVTHVPPWRSRGVAREQAASAFGGPVEAATPGAQFTI